MRPYLMLAVIAGSISITAIDSSAAPLPSGTTLTITQGVGGTGVNSLTAPGAGSKFGVYTYEGLFYLWTDIAPGGQGGIVIGTTQSDGGQMNGYPLFHIPSAWCLQSE